MWKMSLAALAAACGAGGASAEEPAKVDFVRDVLRLEVKVHVPAERFYARDDATERGEIRHGAQAPHERVEQHGAALGGKRRRHCQPRGEHVDRVVAAVGTDERREAAREQCRTDQQHARNRHLPGHDQAARARQIGWLPTNRLPVLPGTGRPPICRVCFAGGTGRTGVLSTSQLDIRLRSRPHRIGPHPDRSRAIGNLKSI